MTGTGTPQGRPDGVGLAAIADTVRDHFFGDFDNEPQGVAAHAALDSLVAEIARLREALLTICEIGETRDVVIARKALGLD